LLAATYDSVSIQRLKSGIIQGWQSLLIYFERQTMYHEYIKMQTCKYVIMVSNKCSRKSRTDNPTTQSTFSTRHRMKKNKTRKTKELSNMDLTRKRKWHECESMCSRKVSSSCFFKNLPGFKVETNCKQINALVVASFLVGSLIFHM
jgi:hypothetical protein